MASSLSNSYFYQQQMSIDHEPITQMDVDQVTGIDAE